jgi:putative transposase
MKRRHSAIHQVIAPSFITTTVVKFLPIFRNDALAETLLNNIGFYQRQYDFQVHGFVIMPSHLHLLLTPSEKTTSSRFMKGLKERSAKEIVNWCVDNDREDLWKIFSSAGLEYLHNKQSQRYQVWQNRFDEFVVTKPEELLVKLNYIHNNPLRDRWRLCDRIEDYRFSSARYYMLGEDPGVQITKII